MKTLRTTTIALLVLVTATASTFAGQPQMRDALEHLRAARAALERAERNKAGHRERAIELVDRAIAQVEQGMNAAR
jgi:hypothetical protein